mmetsp:Transcript_6153/g.9402  ORF Transcript_6153/g.9402 Transcript_6153/m.9402 type:complete len:455 (-) Transcript_6153:139-1503(-)|eukprot:CAMPEP_0167763440 /NCGR_PEP_ID=MMETSP0110_2-20121227/13377_1 /TAXON_ID=629695 /ORGANISM="Gymnochlora sp., Strain CCMP2014" /LENGTH=454 /DNA_ID=CAMNT_0007650531 /DNA_START=32 /DNA_END=1396 /DNA_ORIENTATION=-
MSGWNLRNWLTASVAAVGTLATVKLMCEYRNFVNTIKKAKRDEEKRRRRTNEFLVQKGLPSDKQLFDASVKSLSELQRAESQSRNTGESSPPRTKSQRLQDEKLLSWICSIPEKCMNDYKPKTRLMCAHWLELHTLKVAQNIAESARSPEAYKVIIEQHVPLLETAWNLLQCSPRVRSERVAVALLSLKVATRLKDHTRMYPIFDSIVERLHNSEEIIRQEVTAAFLAAPLLGRWEATRVLGKEYIAKKELDEYHEKAQRSPNIPDMKILYEVAQEKISGLSATDLQPNDLQWAEYIIKGLRIKVQSVECDDEKKRKQVAEDFQSKMTTWKEIKIPNPKTKVLFSGAIAQMLSFSAQPIPMVGPASKTRMLVRGFTETTGGRQSEEVSIELADEKSGLWKGQYLCVIENKHKVTLRISMEIFLEEDLDQVSNDRKVRKETIDTKSRKSGFSIQL